MEGDPNSNDGDNTNGSGAASSSVASKPKLQYLPVPDDPALASSLCPICQEKFEMKWLDEAQEFVWMDARKVGERIFHASCYAEATKDVSNAKRSTPEPAGVLGKRKAEVSNIFVSIRVRLTLFQDDHIALRSKIKTEPFS